ncbi:MAG: TIGR00289 family protein [DPANN group archaeon]|nr:TIGR00289 family protein [DPANN group archaeon]
MKLASLYSGGKDSTYSMYEAGQQGHKVVVLVSMKSKNQASYMFHIPNIDLVKLQAKALGIPLIFRKTAGVKEEELADLRAAILEAKEKYKIEGVVSGAVASEYQRQRIAKICEELGLESVCPLWHREPEEYISEFLKDGFEAIFAGVASHGLTEKWLGRPFDSAALQELKELNQKFKIHISGEGGEYETLVVDGPIFKKKLVIEEAETLWRGDSGVYVVKKAKLVAKK